MVLYEVNLTVDTAVADEYALWLEAHIRQILAIDGFTDARWFEEERDDSGARHYVVHYYLRDRASLEEYFIHHAEAMRRDGLERFPGTFTATRRILKGLTISD